MIQSEYINGAIDYILGHINEELSVSDIASHCNFSRMFKMEMGEGIREFIKRVKMEQSAFRLKVERRRSVTDVGLDYGYSASNYSASFRQHHHVSPMEFRHSIHEKSLTNPVFHDAVVSLEGFDNEK